MTEDRSYCFYCRSHPAHKELVDRDKTNDEIMCAIVNHQTEALREENAELKRKLSEMEQRALRAAAEA